MQMSGLFFFNFFRLDDCKSKRTLIFRVVCVYYDIFYCRKTIRGSEKFWYYGACFLAPDEAERMQ